MPAQQQAKHSAFSPDKFPALLVGSKCWYNFKTGTMILLSELRLIVFNGTQEQLAM